MGKPMEVTWGRGKGRWDWEALDDRGELVGAGGGGSLGGGVAKLGGVGKLKIAQSVSGWGWE